MKKAEAKTVQKTTEQAKPKGPAPTKDESEDLAKLIALASEGKTENSKEKFKENDANGGEKFEKNDPTKNKFENNKGNENIKIG